MVRKTKNVDREMGVSGVEKVKVSNKFMFL